jgi:hypothetical protein
MISNELTLILGTITVTIVSAFVVLLRAHLKRDIIPSDIRREINDLHEWHNVKDEDQVRVWYFTSNMKKTLTKMVEVIDMIAQAQQAILHTQKQLLSLLIELRERDKDKR